MTTPLAARIESFIRSHDLLEPGGSVTCLVSGGADSTCLWHALRGLGYDAAPSTSTTVSAAELPTPTPPTAPS